MKAAIRRQMPKARPTMTVDSVHLHVALQPPQAVSNQFSMVEFKVGPDKLPRMVVETRYVSDKDPKDISACLTRLSDVRCSPVRCSPVVSGWGRLCRQALILRSITGPCTTTHRRPRPPHRNKQTITGSREVRR